jgi:hypothetical protein
MLFLSATATAVPVTVSDLGDIDDQTVTGSLTSSVLWYSFDVGTLTSLIIDTYGSSFDTELGLYSSIGNRLSINDDAYNFSAPGCGWLCSRLSFNSSLTAGTYYLAIGRFNTSFYSSNFNVQASGTSGAYRINFATDNVASTVPVPEPGALALLGLGLVGMAARRRKTV